MVERGADNDKSQIKVAHVLNVRRTSLQPPIREAVEPGSHLYLDALRSYLCLSDAYSHETIDHAVAFVDGNVHTNRVENFWNLLKRPLKGTYAYLDEQD